MQLAVVVVVLRRVRFPLGAEIVEAERGLLLALLVPALGGSIAAWTANGQGMMRPASER